MRIKFKAIPALTLTAIVLCGSTIAVAKSNNLKSDSIEDMEKKVLYSKPKVIINNWYDYKRGMFVASQQNKYILLSFCDKTNIYCLKLEENTYADPDVKKLLDDKFVTVKVDANANNLMNINNKKVTEKDLLKQYDIEGYPTITFLDSEGKKVSGEIKGLLPPEKFLIVLKYIASNAYRSLSFKDFMEREERNMVK